MSIIKQICISGGIFYSRGLTEREVLVRLIMDKHGRETEALCDDVIYWSRRFAKDYGSTLSHKPNCWEYKGCRDIVKRVSGSLDICPAVISGIHDGKNEGLHRGRYCWNVIGTFCGGKIQHDPQSKQLECSACDFMASLAS